MKEITRIHIAKTAYEIEIDAKKVLEKYLKSLEAYANDAELLNDIEIRITELLAERGVAKDGVIAMADIEAIEKQLGEPRDFMDGDDVPAGAGETFSDEPVRKLYRNTDDAVLGGVLSGIASFFKIDPLWLRIAAVVLFFATSGVALLVYLALCLVIPPARTAAEKLRMSGQPVTLASLREMGDDSQAREVSQRRAQTLRIVITRSLGALSLLGALVALGVTIVVVFQVLFSGYDTLNAAYHIISFGLAVAAGVLLALLFTLIAYCAFTQKITKRLLIIAAVIIGLGLGSAAGAAGIEWYYRIQAQQIAVRDTKTTTTNFPVDFEAVKNLKVTAPGVMTQYIVSSAAPHMSFTGLQHSHAEYTLKGETAAISVPEGTVSEDRYRYVMPTLTIYGPALDNLQLAGGAVGYRAGSQAALNVRILDGAGMSFAGDAIISIYGGTIDQVSFTSEDSQWSTMSTEEASVRNVVAQIRSGDSLRLGKIENLTVDYPVVCASGARQASVAITAIHASTMTINQKTVPAQPITEACGSIRIGTPNNLYD